MFVREGGNEKVYFSSTNLFLLVDNLFSAFIHSAIHSFFHTYLYICMLWCTYADVCSNVVVNLWVVDDMVWFDDYNGALSRECCMLCDSNMPTLLLLQLALVANILRERAFHCKVEFFKFYFLVFMHLTGMFHLTESMCSKIIWSFLFIQQSRLFERENECWLCVVKI